jgi:hypothetical protein
MIFHFYENCFESWIGDVKLLQQFCFSEKFGGFFLVYVAFKIDNDVNSRILTELVELFGDESDILKEVTSWNERENLDENFFGKTFEA